MSAPKLQISSAHDRNWTNCNKLKKSRLLSFGFYLDSTNLCKRPLLDPGLGLVARAANSRNPPYLLLSAMQHSVH